MFRASVLVALALVGASTALKAQAQVPAQAPQPDRYGPSPPASSAVQAAYTPSPDVGVRGRMLDWPGKAIISRAPRDAPPQTADRFATDDAGRWAYAARPYAAGAAAAPSQAARWATPTRVAAAPVYADLAPRAQAAYAPQPAARTAYAPARPGPGDAAPQAGQDGWRPVYAAAAASPEPASVLAGAPHPAPLPTSIYTPAPQAQAQVQAQATPAAAEAAAFNPRSRAFALPPPRGYVQRVSQTARADDQGVRFYSVHRPFGLQPNPAPIPPQFFTATADLSDPAGPLPVDHSTSSGGSKGSTVHATPDTSVN